MLNNHIRILIYAFGVWFGLVILAIANGTLRNSLITPRVGEHAGHVISTVILIIVTLIVAYLFISNLRIEYTKADLLMIGSFWLVMTIAFEFLFGHYVIGHPWSRLLADYNILKGKIWILVLLNNFFAPLLAGFLSKK